jgi:aromatic amino acid aminotransferase I / 2-aminoadipate transaminase
MGQFQDSHSTAADTEAVEGGSVSGSRERSLSSHSSQTLPQSRPSSPPSTSWQPLDHHFSVESQQFSGAALKKLATPDLDSVIIPLGVGRPSSDLFPWKHGPSSSSATSEDLLLRTSHAYSLSSVLDYGHATGSPQLLAFVQEHVEAVHRPPYAGWATCISSGSTSALEIALRIFCNRGDSILAERYTFPGFLEMASLLGLDVVDVDMDAQGLHPDSLRQLLHGWGDDADDGQTLLKKKKKNKRPLVLYTIPSGQNPTGVTQTPQRKRDIYDIAEHFDLVIIEDDPYYFLQLEDNPPMAAAQSAQPPHSNAYNAASLTTNPSYLSLDRHARTIRLDSTSKILAPGLRIGWVTAHQTIIDKFAAYHEISTAFPSGPAQLMLFGLLCEDWGHAGFAGWLTGLSRRYRERREVMMGACARYLPREFCSWDAPSCGMFVWVRVDLAAIRQQRRQQAAAATAAVDVECAILQRALENGVQVTGGSLFASRPSPCSGSPGDDTALFFRLTFATASGITLSKGVELFADAVWAELSV